jgi:hypothetical protein
LIIETNAEQIRTNTFFVLQLKNVRQNVVCDRGSSVVGKPLTTVLVPPSILEWSDARVDENLTDRVFPTPAPLPLPLPLSLSLDRLWFMV